MTSTASLPAASPITVVAYYFPAYHVDPRNEQDMGEKGFTEWKLIKEARPRFAGHRQPKVPLWGYQDEALPAVMEQKIVGGFQPWHRLLSLRLVLV